MRSRGPSGENKEYLYLLEEGLEALGEQSGDAHVSDLARRARRFEETGNKDKGGSSLEARGEILVGGELHRVGSTEEQEEIEK